MRQENNFRQLMKDKNIIIPIIQRDYAQGRSDAKAVSVRTRLIDEWIDILKDEKKELRMDFNYIYGNESQGNFYPVDGQQRLTSLYLLYWYLAYATGNQEDIKNWKFDYKTRNSASEFFLFLRDVEKSERIFQILFSDSTCNIENIKNEKWFKSKWENDPTIMSAVTFLCLLSKKITPYKEQFQEFWTRLNDENKPAVYFTCLSECDDEYGEIDAAKKYTRMNARGKKLTDFENLKAMIDQIEMKYIGQLAYCGADDIENTVSWSYDRIYINQFYKNAKAASLDKKTEIINEMSHKWYRFIYYVYCLKYGKSIPTDVLKKDENGNESYEDTMYKLSQNRIADDTITEYLWILKAVQEVLCNNETGLSYHISSIDFNRDFDRKDVLNFVLFVSNMWNSKNQKQENEDILREWKEFKTALKELNFGSWNLSDTLQVKIIDNFTKGISESPERTVKDYFIRNDFEQKNPFGTICVLNDINCRLLEQKIKYKLINDEILQAKDLENVYIKTYRVGYLYYLCGYLQEWNLGDWSTKEKWSNTFIKEFIQILTVKGSIHSFFTTMEARLVYAYASCYDREKDCLLEEAEINNCNNEHIWNNQYLEWEDGEYGKLEESRKKQLNHLKTMLELLLVYKKQSNITDETLIKNYIEVINTFFDNQKGYEKCWLRIISKFSKENHYFLMNKFELIEGVVCCDKIPVILRAYLKELNYNANYKFQIGELRKFDKKYTYFTENEMRVPYTRRNAICTFLPDPNYNANYRHTKNVYWNLGGNYNARNMDLIYSVFLDLSQIGYCLKNQFLSLDILQNQFCITIYSLGDRKNGKIIVEQKKAVIDFSCIQQAETTVKEWEQLFRDILESPSKSGNYDKWIELWYNEYESAFEKKIDETQLEYENKGGQRPKKKWNYTIHVPKLSWNSIIKEI